MRFQPSYIFRELRINTEKLDSIIKAILATPSKEPSKAVENYLFSRLSLIKMKNQKMTNNPLMQIYVFAMKNKDSSSLESLDIPPLAALVSSLLFMGDRDRALKFLKDNEFQKIEQMSLLVEEIASQEESLQHIDQIGSWINEVEVKGGKWSADLLVRLIKKIALREKAIDHINQIGLWIEKIGDLSKSEATFELVQGIVSQENGISCVEKLEAWIEELSKDKSKAEQSANAIRSLVKGIITFHKTEIMQYKDRLQNLIDKIEGLFKKDDSLQDKLGNAYVTSILDRAQKALDEAITPHQTAE